MSIQPERDERSADVDQRWLTTSTGSRAGIVDLECDLLPELYADFIDGLTPDEVDIVIAVKRRLARPTSSTSADRWLRAGPASSF